MRHNVSKVGLAALMGAGFLVAGCDLLTSAVRFDLRGPIAYTGDVAKSDVQLRVTIYRYLDNAQALNTGACPGASSEACYGELNVDLLNDPVVDQTIPYPNDDTFFLEGIQSDIGYFMVVRGVSSAGTCSSDVIGYDETTKLVTRSSVISPLDNPALAVAGVINLPRAININCSNSNIPDGDDTDPVPVPDDDTDGDGENDNNLPDPPAQPLWTAFTLREKDGSVLADAGSSNVAGSDDARPCGESIPLDIFGTVENAGADIAYIHIQEGLGADAIVRDQIVELVDGQIQAQTIQLSGGYARLQLDLAPIGTTDFQGASHYIEVCDQQGDFNWPTQELLVVTSWDTTDTDVDSHLWVTGPGVNSEDHIWYARRDGDNAELDVDDVDGFGPETITSDAGRTGLTYDVRLHYYSDHGNPSPATNPTVRVIYASESANVFCDITRTVPDFRNGAWVNIGIFGPDLASLASSDPAQFSALGCRQP
jgi:hypothetical protein